MNPRARCFRVLLIISSFALYFAGMINRAYAQSTNRQVGAQLTATADPVVPRPHTKPCVVQLFSGYRFAFFSSSVQTFSFMPPAACPGPWRKVVFEANFSENAGVQFDRTASMYIANTDIYFGTTPEPLSNATNTWHVERDITDYTALLKIPQQGTIVLANCTTDCPPPYNTFLNGIFTVNADLAFYPAQGVEGQNQTPDVVLPLEQSNGSGGFNLPVILGSPTDQLTTRFSLPTNIERIYMDVVPQSQSGDEFWYTCVPNDVSAELQSCGGTGFREAEISIDDQPAGVAPISPWIYTGGIDPFLWFPIPGIQTLDFIPYRVDLTPFAGVLSDGNPHTVAMSVYNDNNYFSVTGTLLLFLDHSSAKVSGAVTKNNLAAAPTPILTENLNLGTAITGTVDITSNRSFTISGYVNTSHGKVRTTVSQNIRFDNHQSFNINGPLYVQDITQNTDVFSKTAVSAGDNHITYQRNFHFPLVADITLVTQSSGNIDQTTTATQTYEVDTMGGDGNPGFLSLVKNSGQHQDTLLLSPTFNILGNSGQSASQHYVSASSDGQFYDCQIAAQNNTLTKVSRGCSPDSP